ncbi:DNA repair protein RAD51 homolog 4-like [Ostrinia furnacalis]|uniref:DNA repair protein RAD51 homolog 4-like n=1 Tax=Ostrinia furnacalis TaxID=93504 RepID=UPI0010401EA7|nr:DNA repair protein RAD51 homolog 4-like [Ostrinia furnacalis]
MQKLKAVKHATLTDSVLKLLTQGRIITILDFLQEDIEKLSTLTKLSLPDIITLRSHIFNKYSAPLINGATLLKRIKTKKNFVQTGIESLDLILNGGIPVGHITELFGLADSGKTQLCFQLAINCVKHINGTVLYLDTKGDFSAIRIQKILEAEGLNHKEMALVMYKIKIIHVWTMDEIIEILQKIKNNSIVFDNLSLIIVDSLPCLMFQYLGDENKIGLALLNTFVNYCRFISNDMELGIVCINLQTRWVDQDVSDLDEEYKEQSTTLYRETAYIEKRNRCLGNYWRHVPSVILLLDKSQPILCDGKHICSHLTVTKMKSAEGKIKSCNLQLTACGITSISK